MTPDQYLYSILQRQAVDTGPYSPVRAVQATLQSIISIWANRFLVGVSPSGSFAKGTANATGTDIDLLISLSHTTPETLKQIYDSLFDQVKTRGYSPKRQNVSIGLRVGAYDVDLVPAKRHDGFSGDHSLYRSSANTWTKTNVGLHIALISGSGLQNEMRVLKLWRDQHQLDFPSFYLELVVRNALGLYRSGLAENVRMVFNYLATGFVSARVQDPANTNNIISDDIDAAAKNKIKAAAERALKAPYWEQIVT